MSESLATLAVELRDVHNAIAVVNRDMAANKAKMQTDPNVRALMVERANLAADLADLTADREEIMAALPDAPYSRVDLPGLLDRLHSLRTALGSGRVEDARELVQQFITTLEGDLCRLEGLERQP